jgi:hypothetical protein
MLAPRRQVCGKLVRTALKAVCRVVEQQTEEAADLSQHAVQFNANLGLFMSDLFVLCDRGHVSDMVCQYMEDVMVEQRKSPLSIISLMKYDVLRLLVDDPQWIPLNFPQRLSDTADMLKKHQLSRLLCEAVVQDVLQAGQCFASHASTEGEKAARLRTAQVEFDILLFAITQLIALPPALIPSSLVPLTHTPQHKPVRASRLVERHGQTRAR